MTRRYNDLFFNQKVTNTCICGHVQTAHRLVKGEYLGLFEGYAPDSYIECIEPTRRCTCDLYRELCPICKHAAADHQGWLEDDEVTLHSAIDEDWLEYSPAETDTEVAIPCTRAITLGLGNRCECDYYSTNKYGS